jgi:hypothetical protein
MFKQLNCHWETWGGICMIEDSFSFYFDFEIIYFDSFLKFSDFILFYNFVWLLFLMHKVNYLTKKTNITIKNSNKK